MYFYFLLFSFFMLTGRKKVVGHELKIGRTGTEVNLSQNFEMIMKIVWVLVYKLLWIYHPFVN